MAFNWGHLDLGRGFATDLNILSPRAQGRLSWRPPSFIMGSWRPISARQTNCDTTLPLINEVEDIGRRFQKRAK